MFRSKARTVAAYLAGLPPTQRAVLAQVRRVIKQHLPRGDAALAGQKHYVSPDTHWPERPA